MKSLIMALLVAQGIAKLTGTRTNADDRAALTRRHAAWQTQVSCRQI